MAVEALDTAQVAPAAGTFSERVAPCGCRGVPDGIHLATCVTRRDSPGFLPVVPEAPRCVKCQARGVTFGNVCPFCATPREVHVGAA